MCSTAQGLLPIICPVKRCRMHHDTRTYPFVQADRDSAQLKLEDSQHQLAASRDMHERTLLEQQANSKTKDAQALEEKTKELAQLKASLDQ